MLSYNPALSSKINEKVQLLGSNKVSFGYVHEISNQIVNSDYVLITNGVSGGGLMITAFNLVTCTLHGTLTFTAPMYMTSCQVLSDGMIAVSLIDVTNVQSPIYHLRLYQFNAVNATFTQITTRTLDLTQPTGSGVTLSSNAVFSNPYYGIGCARASNGDVLVSLHMHCTTSTAGRYFQFYRIYRSRNNGTLTKIQDVFRTGMNVSGAPPYVDSYACKNITNDYLYLWTQASNGSAYRRMIWKYDGSLYSSFIDQLGTASTLRTIRVESIVAGSDLLISETSTNSNLSAANDTYTLRFSLSKMTPTGPEALTSFTGTFTTYAESANFRLPACYNYDTDAVLYPFGAFNGGMQYHLSSLGFNPQPETYNRLLNNVREFRLPHMQETLGARSVAGDIVAVLSSDSSRILAANRNGPSLLVFSN